MFAITYNVPESERIIPSYIPLFTKFNSVDTKKWRNLTKNKICLLNDTFKLSGVEKIFIYV